MFYPSNCRTHAGEAARLLDIHHLNQLCVHVHRVGGISLGSGDTVVNKMKLHHPGVDSLVRRAEKEQNKRTNERTNKCVCKKPRGDRLLHKDTRQGKPYGKGLRPTGVQGVTVTVLCGVAEEGTSVKVTLGKELKELREQTRWRRLGKCAPQQGNSKSKCPEVGECLEV